jgi:alpha-tubulin suppressor-like RCC1 family protein
VPGLTDAVALTGGTLHTCALKANGTVACWGNNDFGQLGDGTLINQLTPTAVPGLTNVVAISAGQQHTCALRSNGTAFCWGANGSGQMGNGNFAAVSPPAPVQVSNLTGALAIDAGTEHSCALKGDGSAVCWGQNTYGQLGDNAVANKASPVPVLALSGAISINAGKSHTCALKTDGSAACWGLNGLGQVGDGAVTNNTPGTETRNTAVTPVLGGAVYWK